MKLKRFSRRTLVQAATLSPLSSSVTVRRATAATAGNFIFFHTPNGFHRAAFGGDGEGTSFTLRPSLELLEKWKASLSVVTGLCNKSIVSKTGASQLCRLLTCESGDEPTLAYGDSLDQHIGRRLGGMPLNLFALGVPPQQSQEHLSWIDKYKPATNARYPDAVWNEAFGQTPPFLVDTAAREDLVRAYLIASAKRIGNRLPPIERQRLDHHMNAWDGLKSRSASAARCTAPSLTLPELKAIPQELTAENLAKHGRAKIDILVAALACRSRRSVTLMWQGAGAGSLNPGTGAKDHYELSLRTDADSVKQRRSIDSWYASQFAYLLEALSTQRLLDQTIVVWGSEVAEGPHHNNMTFVVAGGKALGLRQQMTVNSAFSGDESAGRKTAWLPSNRPVADLWQTVLKALELPTDAFGAPDLRGAPLTGMFA